MNDRRPDVTEQPSATPDPTPVYLGAGPSQLFGMLHAAAGAPRGHAVLICPPFGNSDNGSYMPRRAWAQHLAATGRPALRIDLPKSGDSPGGPRDEDVLGAWVDGVEAAACWLSDTFGLRTAAVGLGLGGLIAALAAGRGAPIDDLILWAVPSRGRQLVRELLVFERMLAAHVPRAPSEDPDAPELRAGVVPATDGDSLESAGFLLTGPTVTALRAADLAELPWPGRPGARALVLDRDGMEPDPRLLPALQRAGLAVETAPGPGFWRMMAAPYESEPPETVIATVDAWLARSQADAAAPPAPRPNCAPVARADCARFPHDGAALRETPVAIAHPGGELLGIITEPDTGPGDDRLMLVLPNSGTLRRVGPNRMWTELARRWAARGVCTLRFDLARESDLSPEILGQFHPVHSRPGDIEWDHYAAEFAEQFTAALDYLQEHRGARRFLAAGLSSGAFWSVNQMLADERIAAGVLVNNACWHWDETELAQRDVGKLLDHATWRRLLRGDIPSERILHAGRSIVSMWLARDARHAGADPDGSVADVLAHLRRTHQELTVLFVSGEPLHDQMQQTGDLALLGAAPGVTLELLDSPLRGHVLEALSLQRATHRVLDNAVERALVAAPPAATSGAPA